MVERVSITPQVMTLRDAASNATFSTDYRYLKNVSPGTLSLTQENKIPVPYKSSITAGQDGGHGNFDPGLLDFSWYYPPNYPPNLFVGTAPSKGTFVITPQRFFKWGTEGFDTQRNGGVTQLRYIVNSGNSGSTALYQLAAWPAVLGYVKVNGEYQNRYYPEYNATYQSVLYGYLYDYWYTRVTGPGVVSWNLCGRVGITSATGGDNTLNPTVASTLYIPVNAGDVVYLEIPQYSSNGSVYLSGVTWYFSSYFPYNPAGYYSMQLPSNYTLYSNGITNTFYPVYSRFYSDTATLPLGVTS